MEDIYRRYVGDVMRFLASGAAYKAADGWARSPRITSAFEVEELAQETFLEFARQWRDGRFDRSREARPYLFGIARNLALRKMGRAQREIPTDDLEPYLAELPVHAPIENRERARLLAELEAQLEDREREVLHLYFDDDESQEAVGAKLGLSRDQVYRLIVKVRKTAIQFFRSKGWFDES